MLILPRYKDIFGYFKAISLYRESHYNDTRYNDLIPLYCIYERGNLLDVIINYLFGILQVDNY